MGLPLPGLSSPLGALGLGVLPQSGGTSATITGFDTTTNLLRGTAPPGLIVVVSIAGAYIGNTTANSQGFWSLAIIGGVANKQISAAAIPVGSVLFTFNGGNQIFGAGSMSFTVPTYNTLVVELYGGGGCGSNSSGYSSSAGGNTTISSLGLTANGGGPSTGSTNGTPGTASGGDTNLTGNVPAAQGPNGNGSPFYGEGGIGNTSSGGAYGGGGGYCKKTYSSGAAGIPAVGSVITGTVGIGGGGVVPGNAGAIKWTWS